MTTDYSGADQLITKCPEAWLIQYFNILRVARKNSNVGYLRSTFFWAIKQRQMYAKNQLHVHKLHLMQLIPNWNWKLPTDYEMCNLIEDYVEERGVLPTAATDAYLFENWCHKMRVAYVKRKLSNGMIARLEQIPGWQWQHKESITPTYAPNQAWESHYLQLVQHISIYKKAPMGKHKKLYYWMNEQKSNWDKLDTQKKTKLLAIREIIWNPDAYTWEEICKMVDDNIRNNIGLSHSLMEWLRLQDKQFDTLSTEKKNALLALNGPYEMQVRFRYRNTELLCDPR
jgi:hypothetical protein